jgi:hypothetical protein
LRRVAACGRGVQQPVMIHVLLLVGGTL